MSDKALTRGMKQFMYKIVYKANDAIRVSFSKEYKNRTPGSVVIKRVHVLHSHLPLGLKPMYAGLYWLNPFTW